MAAADAVDLPQEASLFRGLRPYWVLSAGDLVSSVGSTMALFAVDIWVYEQSHSVTLYAAVQLLATLPTLLLAPFAGAWLDRLNGRRVMMASNAVLALVTLVLAALAYAHRLDAWALCIAAPILATLGALLALSLATATAQLVPVDRFARASGIVGAGQALIATTVPFAAGFIVQSIGIEGVLLVDFATTLVAIAAAWAITVPDPPPRERRDKEDEEEAASPLRTTMRDTVTGLRFVGERPGLFGLLVFSAGFAFAVRMAGTLATPLVLTLASPAALGVIRGLAGAGALAGSLLIGVFGSPRGRSMSFVLPCCALNALCIVMAGITSSMVGLAALVFGANLLQTVSTVLADTIWRAKVPTQMQGRTLATRQTVASAAFLLVMILTGPLTDRVFEPAMRADGALAPTLGRVFGTGIGRGVGVLVTVAGLLMLASVVHAARSRHVRRVDTELPDSPPEPIHG